MAFGAASRSRTSLIRSFGSNWTVASRSTVYAEVRSAARTTTTNTVAVSIDRTIAENKNTHKLVSYNYTAPALLNSPDTANVRRMLDTFGQLTETCRGRNPVHPHTRTWKICEKPPPTSTANPVPLVSTVHIPKASYSRLNSAYSGVILCTSDVTLRSHHLPQKWPPTWLIKKAMSTNVVNVHDLRVKLFGPTLDDSVLYGIDCLIDRFVQREKRKKEPLEDVLCSYRSCEALPVHEGTTPLPQIIEPKLSPEEMDIIIDAIVQSRRNSVKSRRKAVATGKDNPAPRLRQTRWAIARINEFDDGGKTYEIMKLPDGTVPTPAGTLSQDTEIVFAVLQDGNTLTYRIQLPDPSEH
uniref:Uncharacterized protein n=1 Tax=Anopheles culicifacies TaxID=139723 RepID=A0A182MFD4_9DIPT